MQHARDTLATSCATSRSKVSNGTRLLQNVDGRSSSARRFRDLVNAFEEEVGGPLSEVERGLIRQAAALTFKAEELQSALVKGELAIARSDDKQKDRPKAASLSF
jgi:hypothetical protein